MPKNEKNDVIMARSAGLEDISIDLVTVNATQTLLKTTMTGRRGIIVYPPSEGMIYIGKAGVTTAKGMPLSAGDASLTFEFHTIEGFNLYAINDGTARQVRVVEFK